MAVEERVLAVPGPRLPPRRLGGEQRAHAVPVEEHLRRLRLAKRDEPCLVAQSLADRDAPLPGLRELGPPARERVVERQHAAVGEHEHAERRRRLRHRVDVDERVPLEALPAPEVGDPAPVDVRDVPRSGLPELVEAARERVADALEPVRHAAVDHGRKVQPARAAAHRATRSQRHSDRPRRQPTWDAHFGRWRIRRWRFSAPDRATRFRGAGGGRGGARYRSLRPERVGAVVGSVHPPRGLIGVQMTILEGSTFCICDEIGDLDGRTSGFFAEDTRFLSCLELRINGARPLLLSSGKVEYFSAAFYLRNPVGKGLAPDSLSIARERFVGEGMQDHLVFRNEASERLAFELTLDIGTDFADIISVKAHDFSLGDPLHAPPLPELADVRYDREANQLVLEERRDGGAKTQVLLSRPGEFEGSRIRFDLDLSPRERWELRVDVVSSLSGEEAQPQAIERRFGAGRAHVQASLDAWNLRVPRLRTGDDGLGHCFRQSVWDLAALRMRTENGVGMVPAAGMPWFMTVFGRDTLITSLQTMLLGPELATASLEALAALQARTDDPSIDAEPGKICTSSAAGEAAESWFHTYYGSVDATRSSSCSYRRSGAGRARRGSSSSCATPRWTRSAGSTSTATATGTGSSSTSGGTPRGLENQSWKDSGDSQRFRDGTLRPDADRPGRGAGVRLRREGSTRRARPGRLARRRRSPVGWEAEADDCADASTSSSGSRRAATTRSRWTPTSAPSTRVLEPRPPASGAGSCHRSGSRRSPAD